MKIKSDLHAGMTYDQCDKLRNIYKEAAKTGKCEVLNLYPPAYQPPTSGTTPPSSSVTYPDYSGYCG